MSGDDSAIRTIAVAGGGIVGLSAAIAFARALPRAKVTVLDLPPDPAALADRMPTALPTVGRFHAAIGLDELELLRSGVAVHHLGTVFEDWSASGDAWVHAFGPHGKPVGAVPFDLIWARARKTGQALPYHHYSVAAVLAEADKFLHPSGDPNSPLSTFVYGLRFDPELYRQRLAAQAQASGVTILPGEIGDIQRRDDAGIAALILADGARVEGDLFIDASGPSARLLSEVEDSFESWRDFLPFDRLLVASVDQEAPAPTARARATDLGWIGEWPLPGRALRTVVLAGDTADAEAVTLRLGRQARPWVRNVLAIGDAATAVDPIEGTNLDLAHNAILLALELLPGRDFHALAVAGYNRRAELVTTRVRDFLALHFLHMRNRTSPESLARILDQYESRGRIPFHEEESVTRDSWTAVLLGMGVMPAATDPLAEGVPFDSSSAAMKRLAGEYREIVGWAPAYGDYLARMKRSRA